MSYKRLLRGAIAGIALSFAAAAGADEVPISHFFTHNLNLQPELSPSGRYLSMVTWDPDVPKRNWLVIYDLKDRSIKNTLSLRQIRTYGQEIFWNVYWLSDDHLVFESAENYGAFGKPMLTGKIYSINLAEDDLRLLQGPGPGHRHGFHVLRIFPDDPLHMITISWSGRRWTAFGTTPPSAYMLNTYGAANHGAAVDWARGATANGRRIMTSPLPNGGLMVDRKGEVRLAFGVDEDTGDGIVFYRENANAEWRPISADIYGQIGEALAGFSADGEDIYSLSYTPDSGTLGLYRIDTDTGKKKLVYSNPQANVANLIWAPPDGKHIAAVVTEYGLPKLTLLKGNGPVARILSAFSQAFPGQYPAIVSWSDDGAKAVVLVSSDRDAGKYYLVDVKSLHVEPLFNVRPDIDPDNMASMRPITFKARDGMLIHGYLTLPRDKTSDLPMIVYVHGGPHGIRDWWGFDPMVQLLANRGYAVLQVNYRGSGGYGWNYMKAGFKHWGTTMQYDLIDGTRWAIEQGYADADRVCIYGISYGGYAALRSAEIAPDLYQCTVGYAGVYDVNLMAENESRSPVGKRINDMVLPESRAERADQSPVNHVKRLDGGIFLIHGGADYVVPVEHAERLMEALEAAGKEYQYLYKAHEGHGFGKIANKREVAKKLLTFFDRWIGVAN